LSRATLGAKSTKVNITLPGWHQGQEIVASQAKRFNWLVAGRRWRKTTFCMVISVKAMLNGKTVIWAAPTYSQAMVCFEEALRVFPAGVVDTNLSRMTMTLGLGRIYFRSLDKPDSLRGLTADLFVIDECQDVPVSAYSRILRPMLMDTGGDAWMIGTRKAGTWFTRAARTRANLPNNMVWIAPFLGARREKNPKGGRRLLIRDPHPLENSHKATDEGWAELLDMYHDPQISDAEFVEEVLCEEVEDGSGVFHAHRACATASLVADPVPGHTYVMGVDWGQKRDWTWIFVIDTTLGQMVDYYCSTGVDYRDQTDELRRLNKLWKPEVVVAEENSIGLPLIQHLSAPTKEGADDAVPIMGWVASNRVKADAINALSLAFEERELTIIPDDELLTQLDLFEKNQLPGGGWRYAAPEDVHDDAVIALALAWHAVRRGQAFYAPSIW
jgi:hypothetical protein